MASLNSIFKDILLTYDSITVPGFGTFETAYQSAQLDEKTGVIYPPTKLVTFNQTKTEDSENKLVNYLTEKLKFSVEDAGKMIAEFINSAQVKFNEKSALTIEEVGVLSKDETGKITLKAVASNLLIDNYGMDSVEVEKVEEGQRIAAVAAPEVKTSLGKSSKQVTTTKVTTTKTTTTTTSTEKKPEEENKKGGLLKLLAIILPIVALLTILFFIFKDNILGFFSGNDTAKQEPVKTEEIAKPDVNVLDIEEPETVEIKENITTDSDLSVLARAGFSNVSPQYLGTKYKKYYLVGGSFRDKANANRIKRQINAKEVLKAEGSEYYRVIIVGSDDAQEIVDAYQEALAKGIRAEDMWLLKNSK
ncbi:MAG: SPOR domain-containing protein [Bacteroidales bacterium]|nr:SPOR domain-containing protein [Bacteroidales bacterium]